MEGKTMLRENTGFVRVGTATPVTALADPLANANNIISIIDRAEKDGAGFVVFWMLILSMVISSSYNDAAAFFVIIRREYRPVKLRYGFSKENRV